LHFKKLFSTFIIEIQGDMITTSIKIIAGKINYMTRKIKLKLYTGKRWN